ncbi:Uncharacterised protein [Mycobacteroides abscessus subsp. abscessus]|nr:Uncharacterised protein [Mycobacteroides abscessus subsp. abscessus]
MRASSGSAYTSAVCRHASIVSADGAGLSSEAPTDSESANSAAN